ncbi:annexin A5 isoform X2 [Arapaima gigas]
MTKSLVIHVGSYSRVGYKNYISQYALARCTRLRHVTRAWYIGARRTLDVKCVFLVLCSHWCASSAFVLCLGTREVTKGIAMALGGTVKPFPNFNANHDAEVLHKAMKGLGTDEDAILQLVSARSNAQRQQIKVAYKTLYGKDLIHDLKSELSGKFEKLIIALMTEHVAYDVTELRDSIKGAGTDEKVLIEILASRTPSQVREIIAAYKQEYGKNLEDDVAGDTSGYFKRLLVILLQANRPQGVDTAKVEQDAKELFAAGESKVGTDEEKFINILGNRSFEHLRKVFEAYMKLSGYEIEESIQRETSGSLKSLLLAVAKCARSVPAYFAESLYYSMKGAGTDDHTLIRIMVSRSEVDMLDIRAQFRRMFSTSLYKMIKGDASGDYRKTLFLLCGGDDA